MGNDFNNINFEGIDLEKYNSIEIRFSEEEKENIKKGLRKKIAKRRGKKNGIAAAVALVLVSVLVVSNGSNVLAKVEPAFNEIYESLGFKSDYLSESDYIGKTHEDNGIKITLDNFIVTKHVAQFALKIQYSDKWSSSERHQVSCGLDFNWKYGGLTEINSKTINENTELKVITYTSFDELQKKGNYKIKATSDDFKNPVVWDMKIDFSKNFKNTIEKEVTMSKNIGVNIKHIQADKTSAIITSDNWMMYGNYFIKIDNKFYPNLGGCGGGEEPGFNALLRNINYDVIKNSKNISLVKYTYRYNDELDTQKMTDEERIKWTEDRIKHKEEAEKYLDSLPKGESQEVVYPREITFNNGNKAEFYKVERKDGKIRLYIKGNDKKQIFNMNSRIYDSTSIDGLVQCMEDNGDGYIAEFNDTSKGKVTIKPMIGILNTIGDCTEDESILTLK